LEQREAELAFRRVSCVDRQCTGAFAERRGVHCREPACRKLLLPSSKGVAQLACDFAREGSAIGARRSRRGIAIAVAADAPLSGRLLGRDGTVHGS
jgi:hypothetical protein